HGSNDHEPSVYHMLTGRQDPTLVVPRNQRKRSDFPTAGSVAAYFCPPGDLPASVTVPRPIGHDGVTYSGTHARFLGPRCDPLELVAAPNANEKNAFPLSLSADMNTTRLVARRGLLGAIEEQERWLQKSRVTEGLTGFHEQAFRMVTSPAAKKAFSLDL